MASKLSHRLLIVWSTLAAAAGCGQILGLSDYDVDPSLGSNATGGGEGGDNGGHAGTKPINVGGSHTQGGMPNGGEPTIVTPQGGAGGEPVVVTPGTGGAAGGEGGAGGTPPVDKFVGCNGTPFKGNEAILRSCLLRVSCQIWQYPTDSISRCVSQNSQNTYEGTKCTLDAQTCDDITTCEGKHDATAFCTGKAAGMYCDVANNEAVTCGDYPYADQCDKEGGTCKDFGVDVDGNGTTVACSLPDVKTCAATSTVTKCGGTNNAYEYQCYGKTAYGSKCTNFAATCEDLGDGVGCYYPVNTCAAEGVVCANDRATWCDGSSKAIFDCGSVGLSCKTEGDYATDNNQECAAPGCSADDLANCHESCDGTKLTLCYGGAPVTVECKDYGFKKCATYDYDCSSLGMNDCVHDTDTVTYAECE